jgi:hypothetical protein
MAARGLYQTAADGGTAAMLKNMLFVLLFEIAERRQNCIRSRLAETAQRPGFTERASSESISISSGLPSPPHIRSSISSICLVQGGMAYIYRTIRTV